MQNSQDDGFFNVDQLLEKEGWHAMLDESSGLDEGCVPDDVATGLQEDAKQKTTEKRVRGPAFKIEIRI